MTRICPVHGRRCSRICPISNLASFPGPVAYLPRDLGLGSSPLLYCAFFICNMDIVVVCDLQNCYDDTCEFIRGPGIGDVIHKWPHSHIVAFNISDISAGGNGPSKGQPEHREASPGRCWWLFVAGVPSAREAMLENRACRGKAFCAM